MVKTQAPLYGLVLIGGRSTRMQKDKSTLQYHGKPQAVFAFELLSRFCEKVFLSGRKEQRSAKHCSQINDLKKYAGQGPLSGILSAMAHTPSAAWMVLACDLPFVDDQTLKHLLRYRDTRTIVTAYRSRVNNLPEPLCAIYEPHAQKVLQRFFKKGINCPRKILINSPTRLLRLKNNAALDNINTLEEYRKVKSIL